MGETLARAYTSAQALRFSDGPVPRRVYIAGPMTGLPEFNFPAFHAEAARLRAEGFDVVNPAELNGPGKSWTECMRTDIAQLVTCDALVTLAGWAASRGASLEVDIARRIGLRVVHGNLRDEVLP